MRYSKSILSLLLLVLIASIKTVQGEGTTPDNACLNELAAFQACSINNNEACASSCQNVNTEEPELTEEDILKMLTDPNFWCDWWNDFYCSARQCCSACMNESNAYYNCLANQSADDSECLFVCDNNGGGGTSDGGTDGSDNGTGDNGSDGNGSGTVDDGNDGAGEGGSSSTVHAVSIMVWMAAAMLIG